MVTVKYVFGILIAVVLASSIYVMLPKEVKISVNDDYTSLQIWNESTNRWTSAGREYNVMYNGTRKVYRNLLGMKLYGYNGTNSYTIVRITPMQNGAIITDTYFFEGNITDKENVPTYHTINILNGKGLTYQYEVGGLSYDGLTKSVSGNAMTFERNVRVKWQDGYVSAMVYQTGILKVRYKIQSDNETYNIRLSDPENPFVKWTQDTSCDNFMTMCYFVNVSIPATKPYNLSLKMDSVSFRTDGYSGKFNLYQWKNVSHAVMTYTDKEVIEDVYNNKTGEYDKVATYIKVENGIEYQWWYEWIPLVFSTSDKRTNSVEKNMEVVFPSDDYYFRVEFNTPVMNTGNGFGSSGKIAVYLDGKEYHPWFDAYWGKRMNITIDEAFVDEALYNFTLIVRLNSTTLTWADILANGSDIRFTNDDNTSVLNYTVENFSSELQTATLHVLVPSVSATANTTVWMYYNNTNATTVLYGNVWNNNFTAVYLMNELSNATGINDYSQNTVDMDIISLASATPCVTSQFNYAYKGLVGRAIRTFLTATTCGVSKNTYNYPVNAVLTVEVVLYPNTTGNNYNSFLSRAKTGTTEHWTMMAGYDASIGVRNFTVATYGTAQYNHFMKPMTNETWYYVAFMFNATNKTFYVNDQTWGNNGTTLKTTDLQYTLNRWYENYNDFYFAGLIDDIRISDINRSAAYFKARFYNINNSLLYYNTPESAAADTVFPTLTITLPANTTLNYNMSVPINFSAYDSGGLDKCWYNVTGYANVTLPSCINATFNVSQGWKMLIISVNDTAGNLNRTNVSFTINTFPSISIQSPTNTTYSYNLSIPLNFSAYDATIDKCWYNISGYANVSITNCANATFNATPGWKYIIVSVNNTIGNVNRTNITFTVGPVPNLTVQNPTNTSYYYNISIPLNYTIGNATADKCWYKLDSDANVSLTSCINATFNASYAFHNFTVFVNNTYGRVNVTVNFTIRQTGPIVTVTNPTNTTYGSNVSIPLNYTINVNGTTDKCWYKIDANVTNVTLTNCQNATFNVSYSWHVIWVFANNTVNNVTNGSARFTATESVGGNVSLGFNNLTGNRSLETGSRINITGNTSAGSTVCLSSDHPLLGKNFSCGVENTSYMWTVTSGENRFNDSTLAKNTSFFVAGNNYSLIYQIRNGSDVNFFNMTLYGWNISTNWTKNVVVNIGNDSTNETSLLGYLIRDTLYLNEFNDSTNTTYMRFNGSSSKSVNIKIGKYTNVATATMRITGVQNDIVVNTVYLKIHSGCYNDEFDLFEEGLGYRNGTTLLYFFGGLIGTYSGCYLSPPSYALNSNGYYNWSNRTATLLENMPYEVGVSPCVLYYNNTIGGYKGFFVIGGNSTVINKTYYYALNTTSLSGAWQNRSEMPYPTYRAQCILMNDSIYLFGGTNGTGALNTTFKYNITTNTWSNLTAMPYSKTRGWMEAVNNTHILIYGGATNTTDEGSVIGRKTLLYNITMNTWEDLGSSHPRTVGITGMKSSSYIYSFSGYDSAGEDFEIWRWDNTGRVWVQMNNNITNSSWAMLDDDCVEINESIAKCITDADGSDEFNERTFYTYPQDISAYESGATTILYSHSGSFMNSTTINLNATYINSYLSSCRAVNGYCNMSIYFGNAKAGNITADQLNITSSTDNLTFNVTLINCSSTYCNHTIKITSAQSGIIELRNLKISYNGTAMYQFNATVGSNVSSANISVFYSKFNKTLPYSYSQRIFFLPPSNYSHEVEPEGQDNDTPIMFIRGMAQDRNFSIMMRHNMTEPCMNLTLGNTSNYTQGARLNNLTFISTINTTSPTGNMSLWMWLDVENCSTDTNNLFFPNIDIRSCCANCTLCTW